MCDVLKKVAELNTMPGLTGYHRCLLEEVIDSKSMYDTWSGNIWTLRRLSNIEKAVSFEGFGDI